MQESTMRHIENYDHVIWDWNGTIIDDVHVAVNAVNGVLTQLNLPLIDKTRYLASFSFPVLDYYKKIGIDPSIHDMKKLSKTFHQQYDHFLGEATIFSGVEELLIATKRRAHQSILSAGAQWLLDDWVKRYKIEDHFHNIFGLNDLHAASKVSRGHQLLEASPQHLHSKTVLIGDTAHDYEVAQALEIDAIIIADGHQSYERLKDLPCTVLESRYL